MVKSDNEAIADFNKYVNMTVEELEEWLETPESKQAGWPKDASTTGGETVGHDSGRKIVSILRRNPTKDPDAYTDDDIKHIHKVVAYCARHLAQEGRMKETKTREELEKTKSTRSLRNWGHDPLKEMDDGAASAAEEDEAERDGGEEQSELAVPKKRKQDDKVDDEQEEQEEQEEHGDSDEEDDVQDADIEKDEQDEHDQQEDDQYHEDDDVNGDDAEPETEEPKAKKAKTSK